MRFSIQREVLLKPLQQVVNVVERRQTLPVLANLLVSVADTLGRTVIAPQQLPAGLLTALVGTPYFVWLLWRSRSPD